MSGKAGAVDVSGLWHAPITLTRAVMGQPTEDLLKLINKISRRELRPDECFVLSGVPSTNARDAYFTHMHDSSLRRFVRNLNAGSAFLDSHDASRLPIGSSFFGQLEDIPEGKAEGVEATRRVSALWYMLRNHNVPGSGNTEDYIRGIEAGTIGKLSIGFGGPDMRIICDEDGRDMWDWESPYYPGQILEDGRTVLYSVHDADLYETSAVYKNATPGALIDRWQELINIRRITPANAERLSRSVGYRFDIPSAQFFMGGRGARPVSEANTEGDADMSKLLDALKLIPNTRAGKELSAKNLERLGGIANRATDTATSAQSIADELAAWIADLESAGKDSGANAATPAERSIVAVLPDDYRTPEKVAELVRAAADGKAAREKAINDAVALRTAVRGAKRATQEDQDRYRAKLAKLDYDEIADEIADLSAERGDQAKSVRLVPFNWDRDEDGDDDGDGDNQDGIAGEFRSEGLRLTRGA